MSGMSFTSLYIIEVFCGTGRLTAAIRKVGLRAAFGVDHIMHPKVRCPPIKLDLCTDEGLCLSVWMKIIWFGCILHHRVVRVAGQGTL